MRQRFGGTVLKNRQDARNAKNSKYLGVPGVLAVPIPSLHSPESVLCETRSFVQNNNGPKDHNRE